MSSRNRYMKKKKLNTFSCDFCKKRKIACRRLSTDDGNKQLCQTNEGLMSCENCFKRGIPCITKIKRKKKNVLRLEDLAYHHKCLTIIVESLYPNCDVTSIKSLQRLAEVLKIKLPDETDEMDVNGLYELSNEGGSEKLKEPGNSKALGTERGFNPEEQKDIIAVEDQTAHRASNSPRPALDTKTSVFSENMTKVEASSPSNESISGLKLLKTTQFGKDSYTCDFFYDKSQNFHYVGPFGSSSLGMGLLHYITKKSQSNFSKLKYYRVRRATVIDSSHRPIDMNAILYSNYENDFSYLDLPDPAELLRLVELFFDRTPIFVNFCIDREVFMEKFKTFIDTLSFPSEGTWMKLKSGEICSIYMVLVLGNIYSSTKNESTDFKLTSIVRFALSDMCLTPSIDGVRAMFLLSVYMNQIKKRETGSVLIQVCLTHSIALGLHIDSIIEGIFAVSSAEKESIRNLWWAIFSSAILINNQMGRICYEIDHTPSIPYSIITKEESLSKLNFCLYAKISLLGAKILRYRTLVNSEEDLLTGNSLLNYINLTEEFLSFRKLYFPRNILNHHVRLVCSTIELYQTFFYYFHSLTLPILSILLNKRTFLYAYYNDWSERSREKVLESLITTIHYAMESIDIAVIACEYNLFDNKFFNQIYYLYHAAIVILIAYAIMYDTKSAKSDPARFLVKLEENDITLERLQRSLRYVIIINEGNWDSVSDLSSFKYHQNTLIIVNDMMVATADSLKSIYEGLENNDGVATTDDLKSSPIIENFSNLQVDYTQDITRVEDVFDLFSFDSCFKDE